MRSRDRLGGEGVGVGVKSPAMQRRPIEGGHRAYSRRSMWPMSSATDAPSCSYLGRVRVRVRVRIGVRVRVRIGVRVRVRIGVRVRVR